MQRSSLLVVPNHSVFAVDGGYLVEPAEVELIHELRGDFEVVGLAAFLDASPNSKPTGLTGQLRSTEIRFSRLSFAGSHSSPIEKLANYAWAFLKTPFVLRRFESVYIFAPGLCGAIAGLWCMALRKPYGLYVRGTWLSPSGRTSAWWEQIFRGASYMIVTGEAFRKRLSAYGGRIVNEVPLTKLRPEDGFRRHALDPRAVSLLFVGRLLEEKGVGDIVRATKVLREKRIVVDAIFAGGGTSEELAALKQVSEDCGVQDRVRLLGHVEPSRLREVYKDASIYVFPSYYPEGFPRVLYEAMMFGLPIVTTDMPGLEGVLIDNENCLKCRSRDPSSLAEAIRRLVDDPDLATRLGLSARQAVESIFADFSHASHAQQLIHLSQSSTG